MRRACRAVDSRAARDRGGWQCCRRRGRRGRGRHLCPCSWICPCPHHRAGRVRPGPRRPCPVRACLWPGCSRCQADQPGRADHSCRWAGRAGPGRACRLCHARRGPAGAIRPCLCRPRGPGRRIGRRIGRRSDHRRGPGRACRLCRARRGPAGAIRPCLCRLRGRGQRSGRRGGRQGGHQLEGGRCRARQRAKPAAPDAHLYLARPRNHNHGHRARRSCGPSRRPGYRSGARACRGWRAKTTADYRPADRSRRCLYAIPVCSRYTLISNSLPANGRAAGEQVTGAWPHCILFGPSARVDGIIPY